jgi:predicted Zn finger-like uncharacterized protein
VSLATRCTSCGTVFRVVQDQLKVSEGWVRCGRCEQVFNALEGLFDLERTGMMGLDEADRASLADLPHPDDALTEHQVEGSVEEDEDDPLLVQKIDAHLFGTRRAESAPAPSTLVSKRDRLDFDDARFDTDLFDDEVDEPVMAPMVAPETAPPPEPAAPPAPVAPEFLRQAQRRARWQRPRVRLALGVIGALFAIGLSLQTAHHFRDMLAAQWPSTRPALVAWCEVAGCTVGTPRRIDDIVVDSTALTKLGDDSFRLAVNLRNRGAVQVMLPSVELSLTDLSGQLLARRVLAPQDFRAAGAPLAPGAELALQVPLSVGPLRVSGFTVEVFYP